MYCVLSIWIEELIPLRRKNFRYKASLPGLNNSQHLVKPGKDVHRERPLSDRNS